jgi:hypothetical protein
MALERLVVVLILTLLGGFYEHVTMVRFFLSYGTCYLTTAQKLNTNMPPNAIYMSRREWLNLGVFYVA